MRCVNDLFVLMGCYGCARSDIHVHDPDAHAESGLTNADRRLLIGALEYKDKRCPALFARFPCTWWQLCSICTHPSASVLCRAVHASQQALHATCI